MDNKLNPEIEQRIRALGDEIAAAHDLDGELREELRGHLEEKVLGYLNGEVVVSEDDAFMLAREHFGDRRRLKELLNDVYHVEATGALWRRMAAGFVAMYGIGVVVAVFMALALSLAAAGEPNSFQNRPWVRLALISVFMVAYLVLVVTVFAWQKRRLETGGTIWFARWPAWSLWAVVVALFLAGPVWDQTVGVLGVVSTSHDASTSTNDPFGIVLLSAALVAVWVLGVSTVWMWWCDSPPRTPKALRTAAGALAAGIFIDSFLQSQFVFTTEPPLSGGYTLLTIGEGHWIWRTLSWGQIASLSVCLLVAVVIALMGWAAYAFALWLGKGRQPQIAEK